MAAGNLQAFLLKLEKDLTKKSKVYRKYTSDVKPHTFYLSRAGLQSQIRFQMIRDGLNPDTEEVKGIISSYFKDLKQAFTGNLYGVTVHRRKLTNVSFSVTVSPAEDHKDYFTHKNSFVLLKSIMFNSKQKFNRSMRKVYKNSGTAFKEHSFLDIGHSSESAVWDNRVSDSLLSFGEMPTSLMNISEVAAIWSLVKVDSKGEIDVSLESSSKNRSKGAKFAKRDKVHLQGLIADALLKLDAEDLKGSDSLVGRKKKEVRKKVLTPFKKVKNAKVVEKETTKFVESKAASKLAVSRKVKEARGKRAVAAKAKRIKKRSAAMQPLQLIGLINKQLPDTVRKNMKEPALVNRTGRFAESVQVTDIVKTPKGFPSIGYTYQRNPYQVFEEGSSGNWANGNRDPRDLIDKSIREIAAQFAIGRFYTRRV
jgi:hypothetical protein